MTHPHPAPSEFAFSDADFRAIAEMAHREAGLCLADSKRSLVYSRLAKRIRDLRLSGFSQYVDMIRNGGGEELDFLITALTTNVTAFFREAHHFAHLREKLVPGLVAAARAGKRVRLWSAAASSGEEAYSMAMCLLAAAPDAGRLNLRILATDINEEVLDRARRATYPAQAFAQLPPDLAVEFISDPDEQDMVSLPASLREIVSFRQLNLMAPWPFSGPFDAIFCRNVAIYFDKPTQQRLWSRLHQMLSDGGYLYIGHSERVTGPAASGLNADGVTQYRKTAAATAGAGSGGGQTDVA